MVTWMTMPEDQTEREKFLRLYGACEKRVYAAAFRVLRDPAPTEDAAQQAWLRLLQSWERVSTFGLEEACGYAVTVAKNAAIDLLRAQRYTVSFSDEWETQMCIRDRHLWHRRTARFCRPLERRGGNLAAQRHCLGESGCTACEAERAAWLGRAGGDLSRGG